jgi:GTP-binding protein HflX
MIELATNERERCILVGVSTRQNPRSAMEQSLNELALLADTAGATVVGRLTQDRDRVDVATFIGKGKTDELAAMVKQQSVPLVIFDDDLTATQVRNLERVLECKVLDRSGLILDIFASRARSMEAKTQVELAQLEYLLPRLTRQWTHLSKQYGGIGTKGPGETQIETDRRMIRTRISHLREKLDRIGRQRITQRKARSRYTRAALVGYTNAGKSTLLNLLSGSEVFVENRLFATLDPTTRIVPLVPGIDILVTDTVGFIKKLPPTLVASFKSTLEEITEADLLLHMVDISDPAYEEHLRVVQETLDDLGTADRPRLLVFNKIDLLAERTLMHAVAAQHHPSVFISAARGINILGLKEGIHRLLEREVQEEEVRIPQDQQRLLSALHSIGEIKEKIYEEPFVILRMRIHRKERNRFLQILRGQQEEHDPRRETEEKAGTP